MNKPEFITFTGADENTSVAGMAELAAKYPIEWGVLFSPKQQGAGRYPHLDFVIQILSAARRHGLRFAAHVCGQHSRDVLELGGTSIDGLLPGFQRVQVNIDAGPDKAPNVREWAARWGLTAIMQSRCEFPSPGHGVEWLFDASGGRGISPSVWPRAPFGVRSGFAGGLSPDNSAAAVATIGDRAGRYWIDMESGVRDSSDQFSLDKCRAVCEAVYGREYSKSGGAK